MSMHQLHRQPVGWRFLQTAVWTAIMVGVRMALQDQTGPQQVVMLAAVYVVVLFLIWRQRPQVH